MVEVIFQEVIFGEIGDIGGLDMRDIGGMEDADVHDGVEAIYVCILFKERCVHGWERSGIDIPSCRSTMYRVALMM